ISLPERSASFTAFRPATMELVIVNPPFLNNFLHQFSYSAMVIRQIEITDQSLQARSIPILFDRCIFGSCRTRFITCPLCYFPLFFSEQFFFSQMEQRTGLCPRAHQPVRFSVKAFRFQARLVLNQKCAY